MGQHKIPGMSKGSNYKKFQKKNRKMLAYGFGNFKPGDVFKMSDGKVYRVMPAGNFKFIRREAR
jgi:hypothetical protein